MVSAACNSYPNCNRLVKDYLCRENEVSLIHWGRCADVRRCEATPWNFYLISCDWKLPHCFIHHWTNRCPFYSTTYRLQDPSEHFWSTQEIIFAAVYGVTSSYFIEKVRPHLAQNHPDAHTCSVERHVPCQIKQEACPLPAEQRKMKELAAVFH